MQECRLVDAIQDPQTFKQQFHDQGYMVVRQALPPKLVKEAYSTIMNDLQTSDDPPRLLGRMDILSWPSIQSVLEHEHLECMVNVIFGKSQRQQDQHVFTLPYKWLRAITRGEYTGPHIDRIYFPSSKWPKKMLTIWIPFMTTSPDLGAMTVAPQSHLGTKASALASFYNGKTVGQDLTSSGWICAHADQVENVLGFAPHWQSTVFEPGDVCILSMETLHMTLPNKRDDWRISCDTRWLYLD